MQPRARDLDSGFGLLRPERLLILLLALLVAMASAPAFARGAKGHPAGRHAGTAHSGGHYRPAPRVGLGVFVAAPFWFYAPAVRYPPVVLSPSAPPVYIERASETPAAELAPGYWYYCAQAGAYYPEVRECTGAWQPVAPQTAESR